MAKQVVKRYNVSVAKKYVTSQGEEKTSWINIGSAVAFDDGSILQTLHNTNPLLGYAWDGMCQLFVKKDQQGAQQGGAQQGGGYQQNNGGYQQGGYPPQPQAPSYPAQSDDGPF